MKDQLTITLFCFGLAAACSFTTAFFYEVSVGKTLRKLKSKTTNKLLK